MIISKLCDKKKEIIIKVSNLNDLVTIMPLVKLYQKFIGIELRPLLSE